MKSVRSWPNKAIQTQHAPQTLGLLRQTPGLFSSEFLSCPLEILWLSWVALQRASPLVRFGTRAASQSILYPHPQMVHLLQLESRNLSGSTPLQELPREPTHLKRIQVLSLAIIILARFLACDYKLRKTLDVLWKRTNLSSSRAPTLARAQKFGLQII